MGFSGAPQPQQRLAKGEHEERRREAEVAKKAKAEEVAREALARARLIKLDQTTTKAANALSGAEASGVRLHKLWESACDKRASAKRLVDHFKQLAEKLTDEVSRLHEETLLTEGFLKEAKRVLESASSVTCTRMHL